MSLLGSQFLGGQMQGVMDAKTQRDAAQMQIEVAKMQRDGALFIPSYELLCRQKEFSILDRQNSNPDRFEPKTIREELQVETDEWLGDAFK